MTSADYCPCGGLVTLGPVVDKKYWSGRCEAGHYLRFKDLNSQGSLVGQKSSSLMGSDIRKKGRLLKARRTHQ